LLESYEGGQYQPLKPEDIRAIHEVSVRLLEEVGVKVPNAEVLEIFAEKGAPVDRERAVVRIPRSMLEDAIDTAPSSVVLCGREDQYDLLLEGKRTHLGTGGTVLNVLDLETGRRRPAGMDDLRQLARLVDALENIQFYVIPAYPDGVPAEKVDVNRFFSALTNTSKHVMGGVYTIQGIRDVVAMAEEIAGGREALRERPLISMITCVMSPLVLDETYSALEVEVARQGIPLVCPAEPLAGATSPVTLAGTIATSNAETLSGVVLAQLVNPGSPTIYGTVASTMDMQTGCYLSGSVEMGLLNAASAQMAQFYRLPIYATAGMSDAKVPDVQAGYEKAATAMMVALAGANYIHDAAGFLEFCTTISYEQLVIDNDILGMCLRAVRGIEVTKETLAEEVVRKVGPGGNFLAEEHTVRNFRRELYFPTLADRRLRRGWEQDGAKDAAARAREKAREILAEHRPRPLEARVEANIRSRLGHLLL
jgi:trimethylamine--corrinoid protein Co-methyltransferase